MKYYTILLVSTAFLLILVFRIWSKSRTISFPLGMAFLYYWTLAGAWVLVHDRLAHTANEAYHYSGYEERLFPILLDSSYFETLLLYSLFLVIIAIVVLLVVKSPRKHPLVAPPLRLSHLRMITMTAVSAAMSFWIVRSALSIASSRDISGYEFTRMVFAAQSPLFTTHQLLSRVALFAACIGIAVSWSGMRGCCVVSGSQKTVLVCYVLMLTALIYFMSLLGNRGELLFGGISAVLFHMNNAPRVRLLTVVGALTCILLAATFIYHIRGADPSGRSQLASSFDPSEIFDLLQTSNEQFVAHFSLYGAIKQDVPLTYGSSIVSLAASVVPRALWPDRPPDIYDHYALVTKVAPGQGYTIHHATGWYLNFGVPGVVIGAAIIGFVWAQLFNWSNKSQMSSHLVQCVRFLVPWTFVANLPFLVRAGPEAYKSCLFEAILLPALVLRLSTTLPRCFHRGLP